MSKNIRTQIGKVIGKTLNSYHARVKPVIDDIKFKEQYQGRIIDCMVGEVDDNYIETPETDAPIVKLEHSKEGIVKVPSIKGKTILIDSEGNETDTPAEGCRLVSVGEEEQNKLIILSKNKNLWDFDDMYEQYGNDNPNLIRKFAGTITKNANNEYLIKPCKDTWYSQGIFTTPIYLKKGESLTFTGEVKGVVNTAIYHIADFLTTYGLCNNLNMDAYNKINSKHTATFDGYYVARFWIRADDTAYVKNIQVEKSLNSTQYIEPRKHKTEILLDEPLRSLPNGVCDEIVGNKLIRRVGKIVVNGSESWADIGDLQKTSRFLCRGYVQASSGDTINRNLCNNFPTIPFSERPIDSPYAYTHIDEVVIRINKSTINNKGKEGFLEYLKINPTEILYELAEPVIIEMPNALTLQGFDDTTMYIENSITPTVQYGYNALIPYKEELSKQKEEVEINTLDIENNIIPYLMDMEFNLMLMEDNE